MKGIAIVLIALGLVGLIYGGISWTQREKVVDLGPLQVTQDQTKSLPLPPIVGGVLLAAGLLILVTGRRAA